MNGAGTATLAQPSIAASIREILGDGLALRVLVLCAAVAFLDGIDTQLIAGFAPVISTSLGIEISAFSVVFSAALLGMMIGSLVFGTLADRLGRKFIVLICILIFSAGTIATGFGNSLGYFIVLRFVTGLGIGGVLPNLLALTAEFAPPRSRVFVMNAMYCGYPLGGVAAGFFGSLVIEVIDWHLIFVFCGVLSLIFALPFLLFMPESKEVRTAGPQGPARDKVRVSGIFADGRAVPTLLLWFVMFMTLMIILFAVSWITALLVRNGTPVSQAIVYPAFFSLGGILGGLVIGGLMDRFSGARVLSAAMLLGALAMASMTVTIANPSLLFASTIVAGVAIAGGQIGLQSLAATLYPSSIRSTGVGWALAAGRIGSLIGPLIGGALIAAGWPSQSILSVMGIPAVLAALALYLLHRFMRAAQSIQVANKENPDVE